MNYRLLGIVVFVYMILLGPLVVVIGVSFNPTESFDFPPTGFSLRWYQAFFESDAFFNSFFRVSLVVAFSVAVGATLLGALAAIGLTRLQFRGKHAVEVFFLTPLFVPHVLLGATLYLYFSRISLQTSLVSLLIGHLLIATPYVIRVVMAGLAEIDPRLEEAAMSLGASKLQAFRKVVLPLLQSSLISGAVFAFIVSFGDVNLALFLSGSGATSLPLHIFSEIQWEADPTVAAASALQILIVGALLIGVQAIFRLRLAM